MNQPLPPQNDLQILMQKALELPPEKKFYSNGFSIGLSPADLVVVLLQNNQPTAVVHMSHTAAKSLIEKLQIVIRDFEAKTDQNILTIDEISSRLTSSAQ